MIKVGDLAPEFTLVDSEKKPQKLSDYKGQNVLLLFFPLAFTSVCTAELCGVRDNLKMYEEMEVQPLGISVDSLFSLARFKEDQNLNFPLLSDFNKTASKEYGALYENWYGMQGVSKRAAFLIDREGRVRYAEVLENADDVPDFSQIQEKLREVSK